MGHDTTRDHGSGMDMARGTDRAHVADEARPSSSAPSFRLSRLPPGRVAVLDLVRFASRQPTMHGLLEVDVTSVRQRLASGPGNPTLTVFVVATLARAVAESPEVNAMRAGRTIISVPVGTPPGKRVLGLFLVGGVSLGGCDQQIGKRPPGGVGVQPDQPSPGHRIVDEVAHRCQR